MDFDFNGSEYADDGFQVPVIDLGGVKLPAIKTSVSLSAEVMMLVVAVLMTVLLVAMKPWKLLNNRF